MILSLLLLAALFVLIYYVPGRLALLLPDNTVLRLLELVTFAPTRAYERHAVVTPRGVWLSPSEPYSP